MHTCTWKGVPIHLCNWKCFEYVIQQPRNGVAYRVCEISLQNDRSILYKMVSLMWLLLLLADKHDDWGQETEQRTWHLLGISTAWLTQQMRSALSGWMGLWCPSLLHERQEKIEGGDRSFKRSDGCGWHVALIPRSALDLTEGIGVIGFPQGSFGTVISDDALHWTEQEIGGLGL